MRKIPLSSFGLLTTTIFILASSSSHRTGTSCQHQCDRRQDQNAFRRKQGCQQQSRPECGKTAPRTVASSHLRHAPFTVCRRFLGTYSISLFTNVSLGDKKIRYDAAASRRTNTVHPCDDFPISKTGPPKSAVLFISLMYRYHASLALASSTIATKLSWRLGAISPSFTACRMAHPFSLVCEQDVN